MGLPSSISFSRSNRLAVATTSHNALNAPARVTRMLLQSLPRFQPENVEHNKTMFEIVNEMAAKKGCTPGQVALGWVHHQGNDVCPIPGSTKIENFDQNVGALSVKLMPEDMAELKSIADAVKGGRDGSVVPTWKNSETPPLLLWMAE